jgi:hypothetical protein
LLTSANIKVPEGFKAEFDKYVESLRQDGACEVTWLRRAQINILLAIGAKYSHLIDTEWARDEPDHLVYMIRAVHLLCMKETILFISDPNIPLVEAVSNSSHFPTHVI